jgi:hypothetical protein
VLHGSAHAAALRTLKPFSQLLDPASYSHLVAPTVASGRRASRSAAVADWYRLRFKPGSIATVVSW